MAIEWPRGKETNAFFFHHALETSRYKLVPDYVYNSYQKSNRNVIIDLSKYMYTTYKSIIAG